MSDLSELQLELSHALQQLSQQYEGNLRGLQAQIESLSERIEQLTSSTSGSTQNAIGPISNTNAWRTVQQGRHGKTACASCRHGLWCQGAYDADNLRFQCLISGITDPAIVCTQHERLA